jgi:hypothetical protein
MCKTNRELEHEFCTSSNHYYLSLVWMYIDNRMCQDTSTLTIDNWSERVNNSGQINNKHLHTLEFAIHLYIRKIQKSCIFKSTIMIHC